MTILVVTLLTLAAVAVLAYPFWRTRDDEARANELAIELARSIRRARDRVYEEIRVLQQEYFLGNLTEAEYQEQLRAARLRAAGLLREQQQVEETVRSIERGVDEQLAQVLPPPDAGEREP